MSCCHQDQTAISLSEWRQWHDEMFNWALRFILLWKSLSYLRRIRLSLHPNFYHRLFWHLTLDILRRFSVLPSPIRHLSLSKVENVFCSTSLCFPLRLRVQPLALSSSFVRSILSLITSFWTSVSFGYFVTLRPPYPPFLRLFRNRCFLPFPMFI